MLWALALRPAGARETADVDVVVAARDLGLITRGTHPGKFLVNFEVRYEIVDGKATVDLPLFVNPD